ncbi:Ion-translocating oxidoreductase complex subunit C [Gammaproteobacteria bacterium]
MQPRKLFDFHGGLFLPGHKEISTQEPLICAPLPPTLVLPVKQHVGTAAEPIVEVGEYVRKGQKIARASGLVSASVHASSSGRILEIGNFPVPHPSGLEAPCIIIETDGEDQWSERIEMANWEEVDPTVLFGRIQEAGVVGLGGAGFPTDVKLRPAFPIQTLILNGVECEPYVTTDDMLMRTRAHEVLIGLKIMVRILSPKEIIIAVGDDKPEAYQSLCKIADAEVEVVRVTSRYTAGSTRQLIRILTGKESPSGSRSAQMGILCHNVSTSAAVYRAVVLGEPLISRVLTVTGAAVPMPRNFEVRIGTPVDFLLQSSKVERTSKVVLGGPMMGFALPNLQVPVTKTAHCVLCLTETPELPSAKPCIRCSACVEVCPCNLLPQELYRYSRGKVFEQARAYSLFDCIECGCCVQVCPSNIPLVHYYRFAKDEIRAQETSRQKADRARLRHEAKVSRLDREAQEKAERIAQKKANASQTSTENEEKKAAIAAAIARVRAKHTNTDLTGSV